MRKSNSNTAASTTTHHRRQHHHHHQHHNLFIIFLFCLLSVAVINIRIGGLGGTLCSQQRQQQLMVQNMNMGLAVSVENNNNTTTTNNSVAATIEEDKVVLSSSTSSLRKRQPNSSYLSLAESTSQLLQSTHKRYAYAFYATGEQYACGALVNIQALRDLGSGVGLKSSGVIHTNETTTITTLEFIIVTYGFDTTTLEQQALKMNVIIKKVNHLKTFFGANHYYNGKSFVCSMVLLLVKSHSLT